MLRCLLGKSDVQELELILSYWENMLMMYVIFNILFVLERSHMVFCIHLSNLLLILLSLLPPHLLPFIFFLLFSVLTIYLCLLQAPLFHLPWCSVVQGEGGGLPAALRRHIRVE